MRPGAQLDGMGDRHVVSHPAVHERAAIPRDGREDAGNGAAGQHGIEHRPVREKEFLAAGHVHGDDVQRDRHLPELFAVDVLGDQPAQAGLGTRWLRAPRKPSRPVTGLSGKT
jgi:hypothetical protein